MIGRKLAFRSSSAISLGGSMENISTRLRQPPVELEDQYRQSPFEYEETAPTGQMIIQAGFVVIVGSTISISNPLTIRHPEVFADSSGDLARELS